MKKIISFIILTTLFVNLLAIGAVAAQPSEKIPVIVKFNGKADAALIRAHGGNIKYEYNIISAIACSLPAQAIEALKRNPVIETIELDYEVHALDLELDNSWGVDRIDADVVHSYPNTGVGAKVAIIDTGIDGNHEDLVGSIGGWVDYVNGLTTPYDDAGHGTHCSGIVSAADNGFGVVGVAPDAMLYVAKVLDSSGSGSLSDVVAGIEWAVGQGVDVISMSLGADVYVAALEDACDSAAESGVLLVAAAGNDYRAIGRRGELDTVDYPGRFGSVIAVGATDINDNKASFSSTGPDVEIAAPGVDILSTYPGGYAIGSGTSMATPHVAGVAALIFASGVESAAEVRTILRETADDLGAVGFDYWYGYGLVDADEAAPEPAEDTLPPTISDLTPAEGSVTNNVKPLISAKVVDPSGIDTETITMKVNDESVTPDFDGVIVSYVPVNDLVDQTYTIILTATDLAGNLASQSWSFTVDTIAPDPVTDLQVTTISSSQLDLAWTAITDATEYVIYRDDLPIDSTISTLYHDTGLEAATTYSYKVIAVDEAGNPSPNSNTVEGTTGEASPTLEFDASTSIEINPIQRGKNTFYQATATVTVTDASTHEPLEGVTVSGHWTGATSDSDIGITNNEGIVTLTSDSVKAQTEPTFDFVIDSMVIN